jgi:multidrug resistance efflux pump
MPVRIAVIVAVAIGLAAALFWSQRSPAQLKVSGFLEADEIRVGSRIGGRVKTVTAVEGQHVSPGQLLLELEPFDLEELRNQAAATLAERVAEYEKRKAGNRPEEVAQAKAKAQQLEAHLAALEHGPREQEIAAAAAQLDLANAELKLASLKHTRAENLFARGAMARGEYDQVASELSVAQANVRVRQANLDLLKAGTRPEEIDQARAQLREAQEAAKLVESGYRAEEIAEAKAAVDAARAALAAVERQLAELRLVAPVEGEIEAVDLQPGDLVAANAPAVSLIDLGSLWVRAYVPENLLAIHVGQELPVSVDSYPGRTFRGQITFIARQAEFTPGNVQTPEERSKQVFRIKVALLEGKDLLRPGMAADVRLDGQP